MGSEREKRGWICVNRVGGIDEIEGTGREGRGEDNHSTLEVTKVMKTGKEQVSE